MQILISSVSAQNPPVLLPPKRVCPLPICPSRRCRSQPLPGVSRKRRYNTLDFPGKSRVPTGVLLAPIGNPEPRGYSPLDTPCFRLLCIYKPDLTCILHCLRKCKSHRLHSSGVCGFSLISYWQIQRHLTIKSQVPLVLMLLLLIIRCLIYI